MKKFDLIDYKGKFDIIQDKEELDDGWDTVVGEIDFELASNQTEVSIRKTNARYYGVPAYIGKDKELNKLYNN